MSLKLINAKNLTKSFDDFIAVDNIDLDVSRGEVVGFLGPNGAGKSTTMKMLTGFLEPDSGSIEICNVDIVNSDGNINYIDIFNECTIQYKIFLNEDNLFGLMVEFFRRSHQKQPVRLITYKGQ